MIKAVLFDFDGVLVDSEKTKFSIVKDLLAEKGQKLGDELFAKFIGTKTGFFVNTHFPHMKEEDVSWIVSKWRKRRPQESLIREMKQLIEYLHTKNISLGIVTGTDKVIVEEALGDCYDLFTVFITGEDADSKPSPQGYFLAIGKIDVLTSEIVVIEDSLAGVMAAQKADLSVWSVGNKSCAEKHFDTPAALLEYFQLIV